MIAAGSAGLLLAAVLLLAPRMLRRGLTPPAEVPSVLPEDSGLVGARSVWIAAPRGRRLFAWYANAPGCEPSPAVVLLHGWGGHARHLLHAAAALQRAGYAVLLPEARNHGRSDRTVPLDDALALQARRGSAKAQLCVVEGTHEQFDDETLLFETVQQFLKRSLANAAPAPEAPRR